jgi:hypothetical protein
MSPLSSKTLRTLVLAAAGLGAAPQALALGSTAELKRACETSPGNVVTLNVPTQIDTGVQAPRFERVTTPCTIVLAGEASLEFTQVSMLFTGALTVQSAIKTAVILNGTQLQADTVTVSLLGTDSTLSTAGSRLRASRGAIQASFGEQADLLLVEQLPGQVYGLQAATSLQISAGAGFNGEINGISISAPRGLSSRMEGDLGTLSLLQVQLLAPLGDVNLFGAGQDTRITLADARFEYGRNATVRLAGAKSAISMARLNWSAGAQGRLVPGAVVIEAGSEADPESAVEIVDSFIGNVASVSVLASSRGNQGAIKLDKSFADATGAVQVLTGARGTTEVKFNDLQSDRLIRVGAGAGGTCIEQGNRYTAPALRICR